MDRKIMKKQERAIDKLLLRSVERLDPDLKAYQAFKNDNMANIRFQTKLDGLGEDGRVAYSNLSTFVQKAEFRKAVLADDWPEVDRIIAGSKGSVIP